ncbi:DedA family protein [Sphingomonas sp. KRR8]|uniref:DedA family protein n=1 Tax=Sphingomonas sp. KRR8 TaxID=2942996 RepID=UPI002021378C|nr:DedA family protein [Sphingomonas sp. KRR8]URD62181.1 DedA family protein [Sphingomonas sp. KRR8]
MSNWVIRLIEESGYLGVAFLMFLETVFPPIPSEVIMSVAGVAAAKGQLSLLGAIASGTAGAMLGNSVWYLAARTLGIVRLRPVIDRHGRWLTLSWTEVERAERWFRKYGGFFVFLGRLLPTVRSLVSVPAGLLQMRVTTFLLFSTIGTAGWTTLLAVAGYKLRERFGEVDEWLGPVSNAILVIMVLGYGWRLVTFRPRGRD